MTTIRQLEANRRNAQRSRGPLTAAGKARSRQNPWRHGLTAEKIIIKGEDAAEFDALSAEMRNEYQPSSGLEMVLVDRLIVYEWRMRRVPYLEASLINDSLDEIEQRRITTIGGERPHKTLASMTYNAIDVLERLARYQASLRNGFDKTLQQLWFVQERRRNQELQERTIEVTSSSSPRSSSPSDVSLPPSTD